MMSLNRAPTSIAAIAATPAKIRTWLALWSLAVFVVAVFQVESAAARSAVGRPGPLTPETCRFPVEPELGSLTRCYRLTVPRNYARLSDGTFDIAVAVQQPAVPIPGRPPVLLLHGGPGGGGLTGVLGRRAAAFSPGAVTVTFDQRGNGLSDPAICNDIPLVTREAIAAPGDGFTTVWRINEPYARCRARLDGAGVKPEHFGTRVTSRDAEELRHALRIEQWDVISVSYGTIVALDMLAANPAGIRSVVLDSPVGLVPHPQTVSAEFERPVLNIFAACAEDAQCAQAYPRLQKEFRSTLRELDQNPLIVSLDPSATGGLAQADLNGLDFEYLLRRLMRSTTGIGSIPRAMQAARERDVEALRPLVTNAMAAVPETNTMGRPAVMCRDQVELSEVRPPTRSWDFGQLFGICRIWGSPGTAPRLPERPRSRILILIGEIDPYYEPAVVRSIQGRLGDRSRTIMFPAATHGVWSRGCSGNIVAAFFADPNAVLDARCMEAMPKIDFIVSGVVPATS